MAPRHPISRDKALPTLWLMTDERMGEALWPALAALPRGSGVVFRHFGAHERDALLARVARIARRRRLVLVIGTAPHQHRFHRHPGLVPGSTVVRADRQQDSRHRGCRDKPSMTVGGLRLGGAHSLREGLAARRAGATAILVSPIYPTRSHPGSRTLGPLRAARIARAIGLPAIALGGMTHARFKRMKALGFIGWAAIDGLTPAPRA
jgi:thiamine-phosphate pyrophosphorylase